jgi:hypothetical protein
MIAQDVKGETVLPIPAMERLVRMARANGYIVIDNEGIWQKQANGAPLEFTDSLGRNFFPPVPRSIFDAWHNGELIRQDISAHNTYGPVFVIAPDTAVSRIFTGRRGDSAD